MLFIFETEIVSFSSISRHYTSLQASCQIFVDRPALLGRPISRSLASDVQIHFIYPMCHTALLLLIFITFCVLNGIVSYDQSKLVTNVDGFNRRWAFCGEPKFSFSSPSFKIFSSSQTVNGFLESDVIVILCGWRFSSETIAASISHRAGILRESDDLMLRSQNHF
jgi:hypothetical protein